MELFPVQYSTLSTTALKDRIEKSYGLRDLSCRYLLRGVSDTYVLQNGTAKYILKVFRRSHRTLTEIKGEAELLAILNEQGATVSHPVLDLRGEAVQEFQAPEGTRYGMLYRFAPGKVLNEMTDQQLKIAGRTLAFNHNITARIVLKNERKAYTVNTTILQPLKIIEPAFIDYQYPEGYAELTSMAEDIIGTLKKFDTSRFSHGYCHYDYLPKNFHFDENNTITLFDFDFAGKGFLANDIASFTVYLFFAITQLNKSREDAKKAFQLFIEGYREVRHVSEEEIQSLPSLGFMFWMFYFAYQYEHFEDWSNTFFGPRFVRARTAEIKKYMEIMSEIL